MMRLGTRKAQGPVSISNARVSMECIGRNDSQGPEEAFGALLYLYLIPLRQVLSLNLRLDW